MRKETSAISPQQVTGSVSMDVGHLPLLARLSGTVVFIFTVLVCSAH